MSMWRASLIAVLFLVACGAPTAPDPEQVIQEWAAASTIGDWSRVQELMDPDNALLFPSWGSTFERAHRSSGLLPNPRVLKVQHTGDTTQAVVRWEASQETVGVCFRVLVNTRGRVFGFSERFGCLEHGAPIP